jgi:hypothetical protein
MVMRDKLRNIKPFHFGPAQTPQDDYEFATEDPVDPIVKAKPQFKKPATISMPTPDDGVLQQLGTLLSNPFDGVKALVNQTRGGIRESLGMSDEGDRDGSYGSLSSLRRANESNREDVKKSLGRSSAFNSASQIAALASGAMLTASTVNDLLQGDPKAALLKKAKVVKPIYNAVKKTGLDPTKSLLGLYYGYKGLKAGDNINKKHNTER